MDNDIYLTRSHLFNYTYAAYILQVWYMVPEHDMTSSISIFAILIERKTITIYTFEMFNCTEIFT